MNPLHEVLPINEKKYDAGIAKIRSTLGSYESIAAQLFAHTGVHISGNAVRRWLMERKIPVEYAAIFSELTFQAVSVQDFYPWLKKYMS